MSKKRELSLLIFLLFLLFIINYSFLDNFLINLFEEPFGSETGIVVRVIDGDTFVVGNQSVRLLGINTPERGEKYYSEAKKLLEDLVLNESVTLKFGKEKYDLYDRILAYAYLDSLDVNLQLIENGYANSYFPSGKDEHYSDFVNAWEECLNKNINLCEKSTNKCTNCIVLKDLNVKEQKLILYNKCNFDCSLKNWNIKDEGRKKFIFGEIILNSFKEIEVVVGEEMDTKTKIFWKGYDYVWTSSGDSLFLRDNEGKLVLWENY